MPRPSRRRRRRYIMRSVGKGPRGPFCSPHVAQKTLRRRNQQQQGMQATDSRRLWPLWLAAACQARECLAYFTQVVCALKLRWLLSWPKARSNPMHCEFVNCILEGGHTRHAGSSFIQRDALEPVSGQQLAVTRGVSFNWHRASFLNLLRGFSCEVACGLSHPTWRHQHAKALRLAEPAPVLVVAQRSSRLGSYSSPICWYRPPSVCAGRTVGAPMFCS